MFWISDTYLQVTVISQCRSPGTWELLASLTHSLRREWGPSVVSSPHYLSEFFILSVWNIKLMYLQRYMLWPFWHLILLSQFRPPGKAWFWCLNRIWCLYSYLRHFYCGLRLLSLLKRRTGTPEWKEINQTLQKQLFSTCISCFPTYLQ